MTVRKKNDKEKESQKNPIDWNLTWFVFTLILFVILCIVFFIPWKQAAVWTNRETNLFQIAIGLVLLFMGAFLGKIISSGDSKKAAISAYRRILDIEKVLGRQQDYLLNLQGKVVSQGDLRVIIEQCYSLAFTVNSSKLDWSDIIGDVIEVADKVKNLQAEANSYSKTDSGKVAELSRQIEELSINLPYIIQSEILGRSEPSSPKYNLLLHENIAEYAEATSTIPLVIQVDKNCENLAELLKNNPPLWFRTDIGTFHNLLHVSIRGKSIGMVKSPYSDQAISENDFVFTFFDILRGYSENVNPNFYEVFATNGAIEVTEYEYKLNSTTMDLILPADMQKYPGLFAMG